MDILSSIYVIVVVFVFSDGSSIAKVNQNPFPNKEICEKVLNEIPKQENNELLEHQFGYCVKIRETRSG